MAKAERNSESRNLRMSVHVRSGSDFGLSQMLYATSVVVYLKCSGTPAVEDRKIFRDGNPEGSQHADSRIIEEQRSPFSSQTLSWRGTGGSEGLKGMYH